MMKEMENLTPSLSHKLTWDTFKLLITERGVGDR